MFGSLALGISLAALAPSGLRAGWSFDTGQTPEAARDLLAAPAQPPAPAGSWLRLRNVDLSAVLTSDGRETAPWPGVKPATTVAARRQALQALRTKGYRLVALIRWPSDSWVGGVRKDNPLRRTPYDLREAFTRCQALARTYGDLIDYWEIDNEPDISFVEENPETYAAFLKACYLGIRDGATGAAGAVGASGARSREQGAGKTRTEVSDQKSASLLPSPSSLLQRDNVSPSSLLPRGDAARSAVLMAPLALPPGPYFTAFVANHGLQYTDGFNYHYYGYAEDFTGVYQQVHEAVSEEDQRTRADPAQRDAVLATNFYPASAYRVIRETAGFNHPAAAQASRARLLARPLAVGEPALVPQGRWLVTPGVTVEETSEGWSFHVAHLPSEPLRPAMAELPLPDGWKPEPDGLFAFEYRAHAAAVETAGAAGERSREQGGGKTRTDVSDQKSASLFPSPSSLLQRDNVSPSSLLQRGNAAPSRALPVFLTEYGYGLLGGEARHTIEGRARQEAWFRSVHAQVRALGLEGAMAFLLVPYFEANTDEFGLLVEPSGSTREEGAGSTGKGKQQAAVSDQESAALLPSPSSLLHRGDAAPFSPALARLPSPFSLLQRGNAALSPAGAPAARPSPALETLLRDGLLPITPLDWTVSAPRAPTAVVLDFAAGDGLVQVKAYGGYLATRSNAPAEGRLIVYNFGGSAVSGELELTGAAWSLADGRRTLALLLQPGERRELSVHIAPTLRTFSPEPVRARFHAGTAGPLLAPSPPTEVTFVKSADKPQPMALPIQGTAPLQAQFDPYFRTANGNLYQIWPRPAATEAWQNYTARLGSLTMTFFGRARLPWQFTDNQPVALVFFFRPGSLPLTFEIRRARVFELNAGP